MRGRKTKEIKAKIPLKQPLAVSESTCSSGESAEKISDARMTVLRGRIKSDDSGFQSRLGSRRKPSCLKSDKTSSKVTVDSDKDETSNTTSDFQVCRTYFVDSKKMSSF